MIEHKQRFWPHLTGWLIFFLSMNWEEFSGPDGTRFKHYPWDGQEIGLSISSLLVPLAVFYLFYGLVWPKINRHLHGTLLRALGILLAVFIGGCIYTALRYFLEEVFYPFFFGFGNYRDPSFPYYYYDNYFRAHLPMAGSALFFCLKRIIEKKRNMRSYRKKRPKPNLRICARN